MNITILGCDAVSSGRRIDVSQDPAASTRQLIRESFIITHLRGGGSRFSETSLRIYLTRCVYHLPSDGSRPPSSPLPYFLLAFQA